MTQTTTITLEMMNVWLEGWKQIKPGQKVKLIMTREGLEIISAIRDRILFGAMTEIEKKNHQMFSEVKDTNG